MIPAFNDFWSDSFLFPNLLKLMEAEHRLGKMSRNIDRTIEASIKSERGKIRTEVAVARCASRTASNRRLSHVVDAA